MKYELLRYVIAIIAKPWHSQRFNNNLGVVPLLTCFKSDGN